MAINKNFVVKNGLEVNTNLIIADANSNKVGIASTAPRTELDVRGGIAATDLNITGVATIATLRATTGIVTNFDGVNLNISGVGTFSSIDINGGDLEVANLDATDINVTGVGTIANARVTNLNATGVTTIASLSVTGSTFERLTVTDYSNLAGITTIDNATGTNLNFTGVGTFASIDINGGDLEVANLDATDINVTGVSTLGTVLVSGGIVTATSGIVTYYGDGAYLQNLSAGIGIGTTGGLVGYGATFINFYGPGVSTALYDSSVGIATIYFEGGGGGGGATVSIGTEAPTSPTSGDLWYNNNEGRIFIYYDEVAEGIGSAQVWVDAAPFNIGIITALQNVTFSAGTVGAPSISFEGDSDTGFYSPASNQVGATVAGTQVARFNPGGVTVTGVVTATSFSGNLTGNVTGNVTGDVTGTATTATNLADAANITTGTIASARLSGSYGIDVTGTSAGLSGTPDITVNNIVAAAATFSGNVSIAGTLTYDDVTNVDSVGMITARNGIQVLANGINAVGIVTATSLEGDSYTGNFELDMYLFG